MPRIARAIMPGYPYHILNRGNGKQTVFHKSQDYRTFIELMCQARERHSVKILSYCLMPNHFHLVLIPLKVESLSRYMQWLMTSHVRRYHKHYRSSGHIWQGRFKSFLIQKDDHLLNVIRYVEANPVRAGLVDSALGWPWSSYLGRIGEASFFPLDSIPLDLPTDRSSFLNLRFEDEELNRIRHSLCRQAPYGKPSWQKQVAVQFGIESSLNSRGRPSGKKSSLSP